MITVSLRAAANDAVYFPDMCVFCLQETAKQMTLRRQIGQQIRTVQAPICAQCERDLNRVDAPEARWSRLVWPAAILSIILAFLVVWNLTEAIALIARLPLLITLPLLVAYLVRRLFLKLALQSSSPQKKQVLNAVALTEFDSSSTRFTFSNPTYADRFLKLNAQRVVSSGAD